MKVIGVTGGIGSGKSTVARIICDLGGKVIDADVIARRVMKKGSKAFNEIIEYFGEEILDQKGGIDRKKLSSIVFKDKELVKKLNEITHKYITDSIYRKLNRMKTSGKTEYVVLEAPIPVEKGFLDVVDEVWVVTANRDIRIERVVEKGNLSRSEVIDRMNAQMDDEEYRKLADVVIENNGTPEELEKKVAKLFIQTKTG